MNKQELEDLAVKLSTASNSIIIDTNLYLNNKTDTRKACLHENFTSIENTLSEYKKLINNEE
jgi:hypothetical protein